MEAYSILLERKGVPSPILLFVRMPQSKFTLVVQTVRQFVCILLLVLLMLLCAHQNWTLMQHSIVVIKYKINQVTVRWPTSIATQRTHAVQNLQLIKRPSEHARERRCLSRVLRLVMGPVCWCSEWIESWWCASCYVWCYYSTVRSTLETQIEAQECV